eukprot:1855645-Prymnesium_polylepis.1
MHGCTAARLHGCTAARLHGCTDARLHGCTDARLHGCTAARMHGLHGGAARQQEPSCAKQRRVAAVRGSGAWQRPCLSDTLLDQQLAQAELEPLVKLSRPHPARRLQLLQRGITPLLLHNLTEGRTHIDHTHCGQEPTEKQGAMKALLAPAHLHMRLGELLVKLIDGAHEFVVPFEGHRAFDWHTIIL